MSASPLHLVNGLQAFMNQTDGQNASALSDFELHALPDRYLFGVTGKRTLTQIYIFLRRLSSDRQV